MYDKKVYQASKAMVKAVSCQLKELGVPFFGTRLELVDDAKSGSPPSSTDTAARKIPDTELLSLQRRMLQFLEDMYKP